MSSTTPPTAAERYAGLVALRDGLDALIGAAKADVIAEAADLRSASWSTPFGRVNAARDDARVVLDDDAFTAWALQHRPDEVTTRTVHDVNPAFRKAVLADLVAVAGQVVDKRTGEVVEWAHIAPAGELRVVYPATTESKAAKALARMLLEDQAAALTTGLREVTA